MKQFIKNIIKFLIICFVVNVVLVALLVIVKNNHKSDYPATIIDKYNRLEMLKNNSKIVITGGSSSCYSIDSKRLDSIFKLPVVNTSLAMSLGSGFQLTHVKQFLKKGDVLLYVPEYENYYSNFNGGEFLQSSFFYYPKIIKDFNTEQLKLFSEKSIKLTVNGLKNYIVNDLFNSEKPTLTQYSRLAYNKTGDNFFLLDTTSSKFDRNIINRYQKLKTKELDTNFIVMLKEMKEFCKTKEVIFFVGFPPIANNDFDQQFVVDAKKIQEKTDIKFLGSANQNVYADSLFYDTSYHMNGIGRPLRTQQLINDLQTILPKN